MTRTPNTVGLAEVTEHTTRAANDIRQAWQRVTPAIDAADDTFRIMGEHLADAYAKDVAEWAKAGHRTWKRIYMTPPA